MKSQFDIIADTAEKVIKDNITKFVPAIFQGRIPADVPRKLADEIATAVVKALNNHETEINKPI